MQQNVSVEIPLKSSRLYFPSLTAFLFSSYELLRPKATGDTPKQLKFFYKNILNGNSNYIAYAMASGFRSINYAEPEYGDTAMHHAVKTCNLEMLEQLLKCKADPEIKNRLGIPI